MRDAERITCADVAVGDRIARTRTEPFPRVTTIDEGPVSRRLHLEYVAGDVPTWAESPGFGYNAGNIRPRREAKLWRLSA